MLGTTKQCGPVSVILGFGSEKVRTSVAATLGRSGLKVRVCEDGWELLLHVSAHARGEEECAVIVAGHELHGPMQDVLLRRLSHCATLIPVILVVAEVTELDLDLGRRLGCAAVLDPSMLLGVLARPAFSSRSRRPGQGA